MKKVKMLSEDFYTWKDFKNNSSNKLSEEETKTISYLHAKYFNHSYHIPCTCSPKTWNSWISHLNVIYDNGSL